MTPEQYISYQLAMILGADYSEADDKNLALCNGIAKFMVEIIMPNMKSDPVTGIPTFIVPTE